MDQIGPHGVNHRTPDPEKSFDLSRRSPRAMADTIQGMEPVDRLKDVLADRYTIERKIGSGGIVVLNWFEELLAKFPR
jgi:hypothetical protein